MRARLAILATLLISALSLTGCASLQGKDPLQVTVAGIEPLAGQGLEMRMLVKLRVQNPNDAAIDYQGVALEMDVQGKTFASGVTDAAGSVPGFGEAIIAVPVSISAFRIVQQAIGLANAGQSGKLMYAMKGKLGGSLLKATRFAAKGEFDLPAATTPAN